MKVADSLLLSGGGRLFTVAQLLDTVDGAALFRSTEAKQAIRYVSLDSRLVKPASLFVPLPGDNSDGHHYLTDAARRGAAALLISERWLTANRRLVEQLPAPAALIIVSDPLIALQQLAATHIRSLPNLTVAAITGSCGKTTCKELLGAMLSADFPTTVSAGNLNSDQGLPLACFAIGAKDKFAVLEMGINYNGEMDKLVAIAPPNVAVITNIGVAHIGYFGNRRQIAVEKSKIFARVGDNGYSFYPAADGCGDFLAGQARGQVTAFSDRTVAGLQGWIQTEYGWRLQFAEGAVELPLPGRHNLDNFFCAATVAQSLGASFAAVKQGAENISLPFGRSSIITPEKTVGNFVIIDDSYNCNPDSLNAALTSVANMATAGKRIAVLGAMRELGSYETEAHLQLADKLKQLPFKACLLFGEEMAAAYRSLQQHFKTECLCFTSDHDEAADWLKQVAGAGDIMLVKGSRSLSMEKIVKTMLKGDESSC